MTPSEMRGFNPKEKKNVWFLSKYSDALWIYPLEIVFFPVASRYPVYRTDNALSHSCYPFPLPDYDPSVKDGIAQTYARIELVKSYGVGKED